MELLLAGYSSTNSILRTLPLNPITCYLKHWSSVNVRLAEGTSGDMTDRLGTPVHLDPDACKFRAAQNIGQIRMIQLLN